MRLQSRGYVLRVVVDGRVLVGLDVVDDVVVARRAELDTELVLLHVVLRLGAGDRAALDPDERLIDVVVRPAEVDLVRALLGVRDLVDVEVERLRARPERLLERDGDPMDLVLREPELLRDRKRDGAFEALARPRVADLPERVFRRAAEPGRVRGVVRANREPARTNQMELVLGAARTRARRRGARLARAAATGGESREHGRHCEDERESVPHAARLQDQRAIVTLLRPTGRSASSPFACASAAANSCPGTTESSGAKSGLGGSGTGRT